MTESPTLFLGGHHAVVTGGGRGLGAAIAAALAAQGADLTLMGRTAAALEQHAEVLRRTSGVCVQAIVCDVAEPASVQRAFAEAVRSFGPVRVLVSNAGQADAAPFQDIALESWDRLIAVNLTGTLLCIQQVLPAMIAAGAGRIVNLASTAGLKGYANVAAYCASKHGVVGLMRCAAVHGADRGVRGCGIGQVVGIDTRHDKRTQFTGGRSGENAARVATRLR